MNIYLASSWRNMLQPGILHLLRSCGHAVYDFKNPAPDKQGFNWRDIDADWQDWSPNEYAAALEDPIALAGYTLDISALRACDACVLLLPSGRSASWEFGFAKGLGKAGAVIMLESCEPELYLGNPILTGVPAILDWAEQQPGGHAATPRHGQ